MPTSLPSQEVYDLFRRHPPGSGRRPLRPVHELKTTEDTGRAWSTDTTRPSGAGRNLVDADKADGLHRCKARALRQAGLREPAAPRRVKRCWPAVCDLVACHGASVTAPRRRPPVRTGAGRAGHGKLGARRCSPAKPSAPRRDADDEASGSRPGRSHRGSLGHWLSIAAAVSERYQIIAQHLISCDSASPARSEQALRGLPAGPDAPPTVQHVVRSFGAYCRCAWCMGFNCSICMDVRQDSSSLGSVIFADL